MIQTTTLPNKIAPSNIAHEQAVLGALLIDPEAIYSIPSLVKARDFYLEKHQWIFDAIMECHKKGVPTDDMLTVVSELEKRGKLNDIGGNAYITSLINSTPSALHADAYAREVSDLAGKRRLIMAAGDIAGFAYDGESNYTHAHAQALAKILDVAPEHDADCQNSDTAMGDAIVNFNARISEPVDFLGIPTRLIDFDKKLLGFQNGLYVIEGKSSHGKTAFALACAEGMAQGGYHVLYVTLEMDVRQITQRRIAYACGISTDELTLGQITWGEKKPRNFNPFEIENVNKATEKLSERAFDVSHLVGATSTEIIALITERKARYGVDVAIVDYVQLCQDEVEGGQDVKRFGAASKNLKHCADRLGIPLLLLSQVSRKVDGRDIKVPGLGDARGSGEIDENADGLMAVYNPDVDNRKVPNYKKVNTVGVFIDKDRLGGAAGKACELTQIERTGALVNKAN